MKTTKTQTLIRVLIVFGILVLLNVISIRIFGRLDLTANRQFSLADASKELMRNLDDRVTVKAYFTEDLPAPYNNNRRLVLDQLNEYKAYAGGNLQFEFIDPSEEKTEQEAAQLGIAPVQVQVVKEDKFEVKRAFMGLVFLYEDRREVIPVLQNTENLEYEISSTIRRLTVRVRKSIGFLTGQGEPALSEMNALQQVLQRQYELKTVDLSGAKTVPPDVAALIVMAPTSAIPEPVKFKIDQYLMRGGRLAFLLNRVSANLQNQGGTPLELNLDDMLETYGMRINNDLIRDVQCANISIVQQQMGFSFQSQVPFPYLPMASNFSPDNPMVKDLQGVVFFFISSVDTARPSERGLSAEILVRSSEQSGRQTGVYMFDPLERFTSDQFTEKNIPMALLTSGVFTSLYKDRPVPEDTSAEAAPRVEQPLAVSAETRVILVGDGDFARDQYLGNRDNLTFLANAIDYLVDDAGLISIRSKDVTLPPLETVSDGTKRILKYGALAVPPLLVIAYGAIRWRIRRARRKALETQ